MTRHQAKYITFEAIRKTQSFWVVCEQHSVTVLGKTYQYSPLYTVATRDAMGRAIYVKVKTDYGMQQQWFADREDAEAWLTKLLAEDAWKELQHELRKR